MADNALLVVRLNIAVFAHQTKDMDEGWKSWFDIQSSELILASCQFYRAPVTWHQLRAPFLATVWETFPSSWWSLLETYRIPVHNILSIRFFSFQAFDNTGFLLPGPLTINKTYALRMNKVVDCSIKITSLSSNDAFLSVCTLGYVIFESFFDENLFRVEFLLI